MKKKLHDNICIILSCIMFGIFFIPNLFQTWKSITTTENFLSAVIAIFIGIIGVAFPIIIGNVGKTLSTYNNQYISNIFKEEKSYKRMFRILIFLSITIVVYFFYSTYNGKFTHICPLPSTLKWSPKFTRKWSLKFTLKWSPKSEFDFCLSGL